MAVKVSGDFAKKLDRWSELLEDAQVIVKHTSRAQAEVALTLIGEGFDDQTDPYGRKWKRKQRPDGRKVLHGETTRLRNGWHVVSADMGGWRVDPSVEYAGYHQAPRGRARPTRMMVPSGRKGLPKEWADEFKAVAIAEALAHFKETANDTAPRVKKRTASAAGGGGDSGPSRAKKSSASSSGKLRSMRRMRSK